jgi:uncharacterized protein YndB with AHSA1/START domain
VEVNSDAPAFASAETVIAAPPQTVWDVLADLERWPEWNPDVRSVAVEGPVAPGTRFRWKAGPGTITSTLQQADRPLSIAWTGTTMGIRAMHAWRLEPRDGGTLARTEESFEGLLARLLRARMQRMLQRSLDSGLDHLKAEAERRAAA